MAGDDASDLPQALSHPDFVPVNTLVESGGHLTVIDWTGAGHAARIWPLGFLLSVAGPRHAAAVASGYRSHVALEREELDRLGPTVATRALVLDAWAFATGRQGLAETADRMREAIVRADTIAQRARAILCQPG